MTCATHVPVATNTIVPLNEQILPLYLQEGTFPFAHAI